MLESGRSIVDRWPAPAWALALLAWLLLVALYLTVEFTTGRIPKLLDGSPPREVGCTWLVGDYRISLVGLLLLCYVTCAQVYLNRWTRQNLKALEEYGQKLEAPAKNQQLPSFLIGVFGVLVCLAVGYDISERPIEWTSDYWIFPHIFNWSWCFLFGWSAGRFLLAVFTTGYALRSTAREIPRVDLFDTRFATPFARQASQTALLVLIFVGIVSVHFVDTGAGWISLVVVFSLLAVTSIVSVIPMLGYRNTVVAEKTRALASVREAISRHGRGLFGNEPANDRPKQELSDLVAMERRLNEVAEWPVSFSSALRLGFYFAIGLGSWVGAAMIERILDVWLG